MATPVRDVSLYTVSPGNTTRASHQNNALYLSLTETDYGLYGSRPGSPAVSQQYLATDSGVFYMALEAGTLTPIASTKVQMGDDLDLYGAVSDTYSKVQLSASRTAVGFGQGGSNAHDTFVQREATEVVAIRNAANSAYGIMRGLAPVGDNDYVTKSHHDTHASSGANPHGVSAGQTGAVALAGGIMTGDLQMSGADITLLRDDRILVGSYFCIQEFTAGYGLIGVNVYEDGAGNYKSISTSWSGNARALKFSGGSDPQLLEFSGILSADETITPDATRTLVHTGNLTAVGVPQVGVAEVITGQWSFTDDIYLSALKKLYLDGGGDTYITESSVDNYQVVVGGTVMVSSTSGIWKFRQSASVDPLKKLFLDGGSDTYITESSANRIDIYTGGGLAAYFRVAAQTSGVMGNWSLGSTKKLYLDGGSNTYLTEVSADVIRCVAGGSGGVDLTLGATAWVAVSDERLKTGLEPIVDATRKLGTLRTETGYFIESERFDAKAAGQRRAFLIAQDVQKVLPEAVYTDPDGFLGLKYSKVLPLVVAGFNEHTADIERLMPRVDKLEPEVRRLKAKVAELERKLAA